MHMTVQAATANPGVVRCIAEDRDGQRCVTVPSSALTLAGFRQWSSSKGFPEQGKITFLRKEITVDMSAERLGSHNSVRGEISRVVDGLASEKDLGKFYWEGARFVHEAADLSNEPDGMFVLWASFALGRIRDVPTTKGDDWVELEGTPDWLLEIVSPSSVTKDTVILRDGYHRADVPEYWLVDVRGDRLRFTILVHHPDGYRPAAKRKGGWQASKIFGKAFRLIRFADRRGRPAFRLEVK